MRITIRLFARLKDITGQSTFEREVPSGATARTVWDTLAGEYPELARYSGIASCAVNEEYARFTTVLRDGDEVAFLPPVSGGAGKEREKGKGKRAKATCSTS
jgi:molybdopterin converting factor subunit 1